jgi:hypothetical protein
MVPRIKTGMTYNLLRPNFFDQVKKGAIPGLCDFPYPVIYTSGTQVPKRTVNRYPATASTHSIDDGRERPGRNAFQFIGPETDLKVHAVFDNQVYILAYMAPGHIDEYMPKHGAHRRAYFKTSRISPF